MKSKVERERERGGGSLGEYLRGYLCVVCPFIFSGCMLVMQLDVTGL